MVRVLASRTTANASIRRSSRSSPLSRRCLNSPVLAWSSESESFLISGSKAAMSGTRPASARIFLPSPVRRSLSKMPMRPVSVPAQPPGEVPGSGCRAGGAELLVDRVLHGLGPAGAVQALDEVGGQVLGGVVADA